MDIWDFFGFSTGYAFWFTGRVEAERPLANGDNITVSQHRRLFDLSTVDARSVVTIRVAQHELKIDFVDPRMSMADRFVSAENIPEMAVMTSTQRKTWLANLDDAVSLVAGKCVQKGHGNDLQQEMSSPEGLFYSYEPELSTEARRGQVNVPIPLTFTNSLWASESEKFTVES